MSEVRKLRLVSLTLGVSIALSAGGCSTAKPTVWTTGAMVEPLARGQAIAIAYWDTDRPGHRFNSRHPEANMASPNRAEIAAAACIRDAIRKRFPEARVISPEELARLLSPEPGSPLRTDPSSLSVFLASPGVTDRINSAGLRYAIFVVGDSHEDSELITATQVPLLGVGGDRTTWVTASIRDLEGGTELGTANVDSSGWSATTLFPPLPVGYADTEHQACRNIGDATTRFLAGERLP